jgi:hypothetical protein
MTDGVRITDRSEPYKHNYKLFPLFFLSIQLSKDLKNYFAVFNFFNFSLFSFYIRL